MEDKEDSRVIGLKQTVKLFDRDDVKIKKIFLAQDVDKNIVDQIHEKCKKRDITIEYVPTKKELGKEAGIDVGASVVCLVYIKERQRR